MKAAFLPLLKTPGFLWQALRDYRRETGQALSVWLLLVLLSGAAQVVFRRQLAPGEFATLNTLLGVIGLALVPMAALRQASATFSTPRLTREGLAAIHEARLPLVQNFSVVWLVLGAPLFVLLLPFIFLPRPLPGLLAVANFGLLLGAAVGATIFEEQNKLRRWALLLLGAGLIRVIAGWLLTGPEPWVEYALAAGLCAGVVLLAPILRQSRISLGWRVMSAALREVEFRRYLGATFSVMLGLFLFTNADRIVAQGWFGRSTDNNLGLVRWSLFDGYQAAGLLGRSILWGTQPLLAVLLARRLREDRTASGIVALAALYLVAVIAGAILLWLFAHPLAVFFGGDSGATAYFIPGFATAIVPLALLQGLGFFVLSSRRYLECWIFGGCAVAYAIFLLREAKPQVMLTSMFSGGGVALLALLLVLVVRWGRKQP